MRRSRVRSAPRLTLAAALLAALGGGCARPPLPTTVRVAAASDLVFAFGELGEAWRREGGREVSFVFGSSGLLAQQLAQGAPYDAFAAANRRYVEEAGANGACDAAAGAVFARGRLALWSAGDGAAPLRSLAALADPRIARVVLANPEHAPYGAAAREALHAAGLWESLQPRLVYADNAQQALQVARSGNADAALVAWSLASRAGGEAVLLAADLHAPIEQAVASCGHGPQPEGGRAFVAFVRSEAGRAILLRHGFEPPAGVHSAVPAATP